MRAVASALVHGRRFVRDVFLRVVLRAMETLLIVLLCGKVVRRFSLFYEGVLMNLFEVNFGGHGQPVDCKVVIDLLIIAIRRAPGPLETVGRISPKLFSL